MSFEGMKRKLTAVFQPAAESGYICQFEELPEVFSEGETLEETKTNLLDALTQVMEFHRDEARKHAASGALCEEFQLEAP